MIKKVFYCAGDGFGCYGRGLYVARDREDLEQQLDNCCIKCNHYEEIETASAEDGKYVVVAIKLETAFKNSWGDKNGNDKRNCPNWAAQ